MHGSLTEPRADNRAHPFFAVREHGQGGLRPEALASEQRADSWFRQRIQITHDGEGLAGALSSRLNAAGQDLEVQVSGGALRLHEGAIDAKLEVIDGRRRRGVLGDVATQVLIDGATNGDRPIARGDVIEPVALRQKLSQHRRRLAIRQACTEPHLKISECRGRALGQQLRGGRARLGAGTPTGAQARRLHVHRSEDRRDMTVAIILDRPTDTANRAHPRRFAVLPQLFADHHVLQLRGEQLRFRERQAHIGGRFRWPTFNRPELDRLDAAIVSNQLRFHHPPHRTPPAYELR
jgi:hypothetical protein